MIDWERVSELQDDIGASDFADVLKLFLNEVEEALGQLAALNLARDLEEKLHFLKGAALNLGFQRFSEICGHYEREAAAGTALEIPVAAIVECYQQTKAEFLANT